MKVASDAIVDVPYCRICRRSSELKWRKHVFSKSHQRAAAELFAARVADMGDTRRQITANGLDKDQQRTATYCGFCEIKMESWREWIQHYASPAHRKKLNAFCIHHRCDAGHALRPQLCLTEADAITLTTAISEMKSKPKPKEPTTTDSKEPLLPTPRSRDVHVQAFLESAATRLQHVRSSRDEAAAPVEPPMEETMEKVSWMGPHTNPFVRVRTMTSPDSIQQNPLGRHNGQRVWGGGIVKVKKSDWIPWGMDLLVAAEEKRGLGDVVSTIVDEPSETFQHRWTESARGVGLKSITRVDWHETVANIHSAAIPPWMVETEDEYKRCNQRSSGPTSGVGGKDIFARLEPKYDAQTWLPNFGGVWQEGSRLTTRKKFWKTQPKQSSRSVHESPLVAAFEPLRSVTQAANPVESSRPREGSSVPSHAVEATEAVSSAPTVVATTLPPPAPPTDLDAKTTMLMAQKERLRAKLAAKRHTSTSNTTS